MHKTFDWNIFVETLKWNWMVYLNCGIFVIWFRHTMFMLRLSWFKYKPSVINIPLLLFSDYWLKCEHSFTYLIKGFDWKCLFMFMFYDCFAFHKFYRGTKMFRNMIYLTWFGNLTSGWIITIFSLYMGPFSIGDTMKWTSVKWVYVHPYIKMSVTEWMSQERYTYKTLNKHGMRYIPYNTFQWNQGKGTFISD